MSPSVTIHLEPIGKKLKVKSGTPLADVLHEYGVEFPCGGKGTCGKCKVRLINGDIPVSEKQRRALDRLKLPEDIRFACMSQVCQDVTLEVDQYQTMILADESTFRFEPKEGYGIALDLGTTTIVAQLLDLSNGKVLGVKTAMNPQSIHGADIISRISYAVEQEGQAKLQEIIYKAVSEIICSLTIECGVEVSRTVIVGNAVMQHIFCGLNLKPLSLYPFESHAKELFKLDPADIHKGINKNTRILFLPTIGSFVGSDILAGILAARILESNDYQILIDLGTNGEIVAGNRDRIICASTAAGPAFEGTNIYMGMRATTGAISSVRMENGELSYHVIGNTKPRGICGSGLIDGIATFRRTGLIDAGGQIAEGRKKLPLGDQVFITQKDIREFQLAKAAVAAGLEIILKHLDIKASQVKQVYIAGAFGNFMNLSNASYLQLLEFPEERIRKLGNTALLGAKMALFSDDPGYGALLERTEHLSLESDPDFQETFISKMMFP